MHFENNCELIGLEENSPKITNAMNQIAKCVKPEENKFEPKQFSNMIYKIQTDTAGVEGLIQIWY